jgi:CTP-dependent riboflavin kinase
MTNYADVFEKATGEKLYPGTINVRVDKGISVMEHFRIRGVDIGEPEQDLLFEICRINRIWAYRIRPYNLRTGEGGHRDDVLEIACTAKLTGVDSGSSVELALF